MIGRYVLDKYWLADSYGTLANNNKEFLVSVG